MLTYSRARQLLSTAKDDSKGKPVGTATRLVWIAGGNSIGVKYHNTIVVVIHPNDTYCINTGGFRTKTTKERINEYSPVRIYQKQFNWFLSNDVPFVDNITVNFLGKVI